MASRGLALMVLLAAAHASCGGRPAAEPPAPPEQRAHADTQETRAVASSTQEPPMEPTRAPAMVTIHGAVLDYGGRPTADASVRGSVGERSVETKTRSDGHFDIIVSPDSHLSATKADMLGSVTVGSELDQTLVIKMAQMPM